MCGREFYVFPHCVTHNFGNRIWTHFRNISWNQITCKTFLAKSWFHGIFTKSENQKKGCQVGVLYQCGVDDKIKKCETEPEGTKKPICHKSGNTRKEVPLLISWSTKKRHQIWTILRRFINYIALLSYFLGNLTRTLINQVWKINSILADASQWCFVYVAAASEIFWNAIRHSKCQVGACHLIHQLLLKNE